MKRAVFFIIFLSLAAASFAQEDEKNRPLFIEGVAQREDHMEFFLGSFTKEARDSGYIVTETKAQAAHTVKFEITTLDEATQLELEDFNQYNIKISLLRNSDDFEIIGFDFTFTELMEMFVNIVGMFRNAVLYIPIPRMEDPAIAREMNNRWKNKWLYIRLSFDYPMTFYMLQSEGLFEGVALYANPYEEFDADGNPKPDRVSPIDHVIMAMPGATIGFEFQFLPFVSLEANFQASMGDTRDNYFINMAVGAELKFPIKFNKVPLFQNIVIAPYGAFVYPLDFGVEGMGISKIFSEFPLFSFGGGIQVSAPGGKHGAFFVDVKYLLCLTDAVMKNPYLDYSEENQLYPEPAVIHYKRHVIGIGVGYKFGLIDRKGKSKR